MAQFRAHVPLSLKCKKNHIKRGESAG